MKKSVILLVLTITVWNLISPFTTTTAQDRSFNCGTVTDVPAGECEALVGLFNSTNGAGWTNKDHWLESATVNDWYGVDVTEGHVTRVNLYLNTLAGVLPPELGNLSHLQYLNLEDNQLTGNIPDNLGGLSNLIDLILSYNQLIGNIPISLGNLSSLQYLRLSHNQLTGGIPVSLSNLTNLQDLYLNNNQLTGSIPEMLGNLSNLQSIFIGYNQLTGNIPASLANLSNLGYLVLIDNQLTGSIPTAFGNLSGLLVFDLGNNQINGMIPSELGNLINLYDLRLDNNQLTGSIPGSMGNLTKLRTLFLYANQLTGSIPASLGNLINLEYLFMSNNQLSGDVPASFTNLVNLCVPGENNCTSYGLDLGYNNLNVPAPEPPASFLAIKDPDWNMSQAATIPTTFVDVPASHWAYTWIEQLKDSGITSGCNQNPPMYCPDQMVTRAQMAIFLERGMNDAFYIPPAASGTVFTDVSCSTFAADWIEKLAADGITTGCQVNPPQYCPDQPVTRAQMAIFLLRAKYGDDYVPPGVGDNTGFADVTTSYFAAAWIKQLAAEGITAGCGGGNYCPEDPVTRAQMAVFLVKTFNLQGVFNLTP